VSGAEEAAFFGTEGNKEHAAAGLDGIGMNGSSDLDDGSGARTVVIGAGVEFSTLNAEVIKVGTDADVFVANGFIAAWVPADHIWDIDGIAFNGEFAVCLDGGVDSQKNALSGISFGEESSILSAGGGQLIGSFANNAGNRERGGLLFCLIDGFVPHLAAFTDKQHSGGFAFEDPGVISGKSAATANDEERFSELTFRNFGFCFSKFGEDNFHSASVRPIPGADPHIPAGHTELVANFNEALIGERVHADERHVLEPGAVFTGWLEAVCFKLT
jgi:hypothetical protein